MTNVLLTNVLLTNINQDKSIQCRATIDVAVVADYAERMAAGDVFPPVDLYGIENECWIGDGWHRILAALTEDVLAALAGDTGHGCIEAHLHPGGRIDALRHALGANAIHGQRRSNADKRRVVEIAVVEFATLSNAAIAALCGVDDKTVAAYRPVTSGNSEPETHTGQDGKEYPVSRTKQRPAPQPPGDDHHDQDDQPAPASLAEPADVPALMPRSRRHGPNRIVAKIVSAMMDVEYLTADINYAGLDLAQIDAWVASLKTSHKALGNFIRKLARVKPR